ncbi:MAG: hypothetical protein GEU74_05430 [Nitriliruptorales bacterium]|nr:hypothetical protein [Nitriliruptorales bacterium]
MGGCIHVVGAVRLGCAAGGQRPGRDPSRQPGSLRRNGLRAGSALQLHVCDRRRRVGVVGRPRTTVVHPAHRRGCDDRRRRVGVHPRRPGRVVLGVPRRWRGCDVSGIPRGVEASQPTVADGPSDAVVTVTLYTRQGCHLCEVAEHVVREAAAGRAHVELVDIDTDPGLRDRFAVRVPVVAVDGVEVAEFEISPAVLLDALDHAAG